MKKSKDNAGLSAQFKARLDILGKLADKSPLSSNDLPISDKTSKDSPGPNLASPSPTMDAAKANFGEPVIPISNLPQIAPIPDVVPDEYKFEIFRLRRQIVALDNDIRRVNAKITKAIEVINDEVRFWKLGIQQGQWETLGQAMRRMRHLEAMVRLLGDLDGVAPANQAKQRRR